MKKMNEFLNHELIACQLETIKQQKALTRKMNAITFWQKSILAVAFGLFISSDAWAQADTISKLEAVKVWVNGIINIIFIIAILYASIMCVLKFVRQEQGAWGYAFGVMIAFILWGGFTTYKNDLFALMGGSNLMVVD